MSTCIVRDPIGLDPIERPFRGMNGGRFHGVFAGEMVEVLFEDRAQVVEVPAADRGSDGEIAGVRLHDRIRWTARVRTAARPSRAAAGCSPDAGRAAGASAVRRPGGAGARARTGAAADSTDEIGNDNQGGVP